MRVFSLLLLLLVLLFSNSIEAAEISLNLTVTAKNELVTVTVSNRGRDTAPIHRVTTELDGKTYSSESSVELSSGRSTSFRFSVSLPENKGTYPLTTRVYYLNDEDQMSLINVGPFNHVRESKISSGVRLNATPLRETGLILINHPPGTNPELIIPDEVDAELIRQTPDRKLYRLKNNRRNLSTQYTIYATVEQTIDGIHASDLTTATLSTVKKRADFLPFTGRFYGIIALLAALASLLFFLIGKKKAVISSVGLVTSRYLFSLFIFSAIFYLFYTAHLISDQIYLLAYSNLNLKGALSSEIWRVTDILLNWIYFDGKDYYYFEKYLLQPLFFYFLLAHPFVLYFLIRSDPEEDKMWQLMRFIFPWTDTSQLQDNPRWNRLTRLAILSLIVKCFYVPLLCSWMINNFIHQGNMISGFAWNFAYINKFLVDLLILIDVTIFAFGYLFELPQLKNKIRSVEPTLLGWVVCLMCYPPFNLFAFSYFDVPLGDHWRTPSGLETTVAIILITLLWVVYTWATVALGWKASNLTNRGIVSHGPYRFIRHPAYASKVFLWGISAYFMGDKNFFLMITLTVVYGLRAWTEERHLSQDPEYVEYKKKVRYWFVPGLF